MAEELCTVDFAAKRLQLHPKTVLRFIREGRLPANRIGKSYRIRRSDLDAFAGVPPRTAGAEEELRVTAIVDVPNVGSNLAQKFAAAVTNALYGKPKDGPLMRADVIYDPEREALKIVIVGGARDTSGLLSLIQVWQEQLTP
jgi:excisionase family DNA binding protein